MLSKNLKSIRALNGGVRRYLASGQAQPKSSASSGEITVSTMPSGIVLASVQSDSPLARVAVVVRAGSRYEPASQLGLTHTLRSAAGLATQQYSSFGITRRIEYHGGRLTVAGSRDTITYLLEAHQDEEVLPDNFSMLADTVARPAFKHWELADNLERVNADLAVLQDTPYIQLAEAIHSVAFRGGLRNSLYTPKFMVGKHKSDTLKKFHSDHFTGSNTVVVGVGLEHQELTDLVGQNLVLNATSAPKDKSKFIGGEIHLDSNSPQTYVAIACEGVGYKNIKDVIAASLLQKILGSGSTIKNLYELSSVERLGRAVGAALSGRASAGVAVSAFNFNYEDSGLFGINVVAPGVYDVPALVKAAVKEFRATASSVSDAELNDAKKNLKTAALIAMDDPSTLASELASQLLLTGQKLSVADFVKSVDSVTTADLKSLGSRFLKSKVALATIGSNAPYLEDLIESA